MTLRVEPQDLAAIAPAGHYIALRIGFAYPLEEVNALPVDWIEHYTQSRYMLSDPVIRWAYGNVGMLRWGALPYDDPLHIMAKAKTFGLRYGIVISVLDDHDAGQRSFGSFARGDRDFTDLEMRVLQAFVTRRHSEMAPPKNLTMAELEALSMVRHGQRLKEVAHHLGVSEGAVKQRLKNAKLKLGAKTGSQAAALAAQFGLI